MKNVGSRLRSLVKWRKGSKRPTGSSSTEQHESIEAIDAESIHEKNDGKIYSTVRYSDD